MKKRFGVIFIMGLILSASLVSAQADSNAPYLYYYSRMLGGIIIEHPDGSDSRLIGSDVIPPNLTGIEGPGWSASGKYFAASAVYDGIRTSDFSGIYVINSQGKPVNGWISVFRAGWVDWSPDGEDMFLVVGTTDDPSNEAVSARLYAFWLVDASSGQILAEYSGVFSTSIFYEVSRIIWEPAQKRIRFYTEPDTYDNYQHYYQVIMQFDGTVIKTPIEQKDIDHNLAPPQEDNSDDLSNPFSESPSGDYEITRRTLISHVTGAAVELPYHSEGSICQLYRWSRNEDYILTLDGTAWSDGCGWAAMGITDSQGKLWRELGDCSWDAACAGWLPTNVDISKLPPGQPKPIQLDAAGYQFDIPIWDVDEDAIPQFIFKCEQQTFDILDNVGNIHFQLNRSDAPDCPYNVQRGQLDAGEKTPFAYAPQYQLLAIPDGHGNVSVWSMQTTPGKLLLRLNTHPYELEFTLDGRQLRARDVHAWAIYNVADILTAAGVKP